MPNQQPVIVDASGRRQLAGSAVALLAFVVNPARQILLLAHPRRKREWEVINGALEAEETILAGLLREIREEIGPAVRVRPLGTVHAFTFFYDDNVQYLVSLCYLLAFEGGEIRPGNDMAGSTFRWWSLDEVMTEQIKLIVPRDQKWLLKRAADLYDLWHNQTQNLQPELDPNARTKYIL